MDLPLHDAMKPLTAIAALGGGGGFTLKLTNYSRLVNNLLLTGLYGRNLLCQLEMHSCFGHA